MSESRFKVPHTLVLLFGMIVLAQLLTYVLPQGRFAMEDDGDGHEVVVAGSYERAEERTVLPAWAALTAIPKGFAKAQDIIFFVFIVGGAFAVFRATGAADAVIGWLLRNFGESPRLLVLGGLFIFSMGSSFIGMAEEYLPFVPLLLALCLALGFDSVTAIGVLCVGYGTGYGVAFFNPFTVMIAQEVAGLEPGSGVGYRVVLYVVFLAVAFHHVWSYARRVKEDPSKSAVHGLSSAEIAPHQDVALTPARVVIVALSVLTIVGIVLGVKYAGWYLVEMGAVFLGLTLVMAIVARLGADETARTFGAGAAELSMTALLIGFAHAIKIILDEGQVIHTIIDGIATPLETLGPSVAAVGMLFVQSACNLFIPSGSGQAYVTMPIMAPLADLVGISRQTAVLAYQFGDGFTNIIVPTNPVLIGILAMAGIPYERWLRFVVPFLLKAFVLAAVAMVIAVQIGY